jgi:hypothetical protein
VQHAPLGIRGDMTDSTFSFWALLVGPGILAWQAYQWLQTGIWTPLPISRLFDFFGWSTHFTDWIGLQQILSLLLEIPSSAVVAMVACTFITLGGLIDQITPSKKSH